MAVTQYIGAAYVAHGWTTWDAQTSYDNMYVVEYQNGNYISKKNVPPGVSPAGDMGSNDYWAFFGVKSAQIEDYRKTVEEVKELYTAISSTVATSIITLGGKNDGTVDIGPIINANTEKTDIYLPAGTYLISTPVTLKNSLIGEIPTAGRKGTIISSDIQNNYIITVNQYDINIANLTFLCSGNETGTIFYNHSSSASCLLTNVSIWYHGGDACINISPTVNISKYLLINQLLIYCLSTENVNQTGILANNCGDSRFTDVTIMCPVKGMVLNASNIHMSDIHIWCGINNPTRPTQPMSEARWKSTVGLQLGGNGYIFDNIYLDTCFTYIISVNSNTKIYGLKIWCDTTIPKNAEPGTLVQTNFSDDVVVFGGIFYFRVNGYNYNNLGCIYYNVNIYQVHLNDEKPNCYFFRGCRYFITADSVKPYRVCAYVVHPAGGITQFLVGCADSLYKITVTNMTAYLETINEGTVQLNFYYTTNKGMKTIVYNTVNTFLYVEHIVSSPNCGLINYQTIRTTTGRYLSQQFIDNVDGYTQITEKTPN